MSGSNNFPMAGKRIKPRRANKTRAHLKYGRVKKMQPTISEEDRKSVVTFSLPNWMIARLNHESDRIGNHRSTLVAAMLEAGLAGIDEAARIVEQQEQDGQNENDETETEE